MGVVPLRKPQPDRPALPSLPIDADLWARVVEATGLSPQLARAVELVLRDLSDAEIAREMAIAESTLRTYFDRIALRIGARRRSGIFRAVLALSHEVRDRDS